MKTELHDEFMGFELRQIPQHDDDCERWGYQVKLPTDGQWYEIDSYTLRWNRQDALEGLVGVLRQAINDQMEKCDNLTDQRDFAMKVIRRLESERDDLHRQVENMKVSTIHTCHDQCSRPMCVLRRERDEAREALRELWQTADAYIPQIDEEQTTKWHNAMFGNSKNG
jgi:hypothetical protein